MNIYKKVIFPVLAVTATIAAGCTKETDNAGFRSGSALSLGSVTTERMLTKSVITGTTFPADEAARGIGLFLTASDGGNYDGKSTGYSNIKYSDNGGGWTSNSPMILSATNGILYGYFPYSSSVADITAVPVESSLNGTDYMYAVPVTNVSKSSASVSLTMKHALARVSVKFIKDGSYTGAGALTAFSLEGKCLSSGGTMNAKTGNVTATGTNSVSYTVTETLTASGTTEECLLVSTADADRSLTLKCTIDGREYSIEFSGADTLCVRKGVNSNAIVTLKNYGLSISGTGIGDWGAGTSLEIGEHKVTVKRSNETVADDVFLDVTSDGSSVTIKTHSALTGRYLGCTCTPAGKADCASSIDETTGICTFTISSVQEDITAEVGYLKCSATVLYDSDMGTVKLNGNPVTSGDTIPIFYGREVAFSAFANSGYGFVKWTDGSGADLSTDNPYTIHRMTSDVPLNAVFGELVKISVEMKPIGAGTVTGAGIYFKGANITLMATPGGSGAQFIGWVNKTATADTIKENPYNFTVTQPASYVAVFRLTDALPGLFTVNSDGKKVFFSKGNLWFGKVGSAPWNSLNFEDNQYASQPTSETVRDEKHISHFMWSGDRSCSMWVEYSYEWVAESTFFTDKTDCRVNGVSSWRTLTGGPSGEWEYLLRKRAMTNGKPRYTGTGTPVSIDGAVYKGFFIYPDDYNGSEVGKTGGPSTWTDINAAGIVFLPAAGVRFTEDKDGYYKVANVYRVGSEGWYWSGSPVNDYYAYCLTFGGTSISTEKKLRQRACSVRLVADYQE